MAMWILTAAKNILFKHQQMFMPQLNIAFDGFL
jgi:hypothetical protein